MNRRRRWLPGLEWALLVLAIADWVVLKRGIVPHPPWVLAVLVGLTGLALVARLVASLVRWRPGARSLAASSEILLLVGVLTALGAGMANWLFGLQGFVILNEREPTALRGGSRLQSFTAGPLAQIAEMELVIALLDVELVPSAEGGYFPRSQLLLQSPEEEPARLVVEPGRSARGRSLRFFQGAFGFSPRIVVVKDDKTVFDRLVPFLSELREGGGVTFRGSFEVEAEKLAIVGSVDTQSLDEGMRGHATLHLEVSRDGELLGRGALLPGHFAELQQGYRTGFAGLESWSEIDIVRRNYDRLVRVGGAIAALGLLLWPLAAWRGW